MISVGSTRASFGEVRPADERQAGPPGVAAPIVVPAGAVERGAAPAGVPSDVLLRAIEVLEERGWHQGRISDSGKGTDGSVCIARALHHAVNANNGLGAFSRAVDAVKVATGARDLVVWQCAPERTVEDVILALKRAAYGEAAAAGSDNGSDLGGHATMSESTGAANAAVHEETARLRAVGLHSPAAAVPRP